jgi:hypothetical protein
LAFYEKLVTDKRYNLLTQYGIEGKNYEVKRQAQLFIPSRENPFVLPLPII